MGEYGSLRDCFHSSGDLPMERNSDLYRGPFRAEIEKRSKQYLHPARERCRARVNVRATRASRWSGNDCLRESARIYYNLWWCDGGNLRWVCIHGHEDPENAERHLGVLYGDTSMVETICKLAGQPRVQRVVCHFDGKVGQTSAYVRRLGRANNLRRCLAV